MNCVNCLPQEPPSSAATTSVGSLSPSPRDSRGKEEDKLKKKSSLKSPDKCADGRSSGGGGGGGGGGPRGSGGGSGCEGDKLPSSKTPEGGESVPKTVLKTPHSSSASAAAAAAAPPPPSNFPPFLPPSAASVAAAAAAAAGHGTHPGAADIEKLQAFLKEQRSKGAFSESQMQSPVAFGALHSDGTTGSADAGRRHVGTSVQETLLRNQAPFLVAKCNFISL